MAAKRNGKKSGVPKTSIAKLTNKRLNRLAKQGKLKKSVSKKKLVELLKYRTNQPVDDRPLSPEDIPLEEADYDYFSRPGRDFSFLSNLNPNKKQKAKKRKHDDEKSGNVERLYEKQLKIAPAEKNVEVKSLLPFKSKEKGIIHRTIEIERNGEEEEAAEDDVMDTAEPGTRPLTAVEAVIQEELQKKDAKRQIGLLAAHLLQNPQEHVSDLKSLLSFIDGGETELPVSVKKCAITALTDVYKDIIPGYRIRTMTDIERKQSMKKEKKQIYVFEETLVNYYHQFLELMQLLATGKKSKGKKQESDKKTKKKPTPVNKSLRLLSVQSLCSLLVTHSHFNFRTEIISVVLRFITSSNAELSDAVCEAIRQLFRQDRNGEASLEVVRLIGRIIKAKMFQVKPKVLDTFLSLKIKEVEKPEDKKPKMTKETKMKTFSKRERKHHKAVKHLEKELRVAAAEEDVKHRIKLHTQIINTIFLTYFRILKQARHSGLLASVLEGLAKFAHLINVSFFDDLFAVMTELVISGELTNRCSLNCVQTASTLLMGQGEALNIDPVRFYNHLYKVILQLHAGNSSKDLPIALHCLDILISKRRRHMSEQRMLAFLKRLATVALQMSSDGSLALLGVIRKIIIECPKSDVLLSNDTIGCGVFLPELDEPDYCNACNSSLYELHLLRKSYHPGVRNSVKSLLQKPSKQ